MRARRGCEHTESQCAQSSVLAYCITCSSSPQERFATVRAGCSCLPISWHSRQHGEWAHIFVLVHRSSLSCIECRSWPFHPCSSLFNVYLSVYLHIGWWASTCSSSPFFGAGRRRRFAPTVPFPQSNSGDIRASGHVLEERQPEQKRAAKKLAGQMVRAFPCGGSGSSRMLQRTFSIYLSRAGQCIVSR